MYRLVALALVLVGTGLACSADGYLVVARRPSLPEVELGPATTMGTLAASAAEGPGEALPEPGPARPLPDGMYMVRLLELESTQAVADPEGWFTGAPHGFLLVNERPSRDAFPLAPDLAVTVTHGAVTLAALIDAWNDGDATGGRSTLSHHFRLTLAGGRVTRLDEQYVP